MLAASVGEGESVMKRVACAAVVEVEEKEDLECLREVV
jgi:hypothetical protein